MDNTELQHQFFNLVKNQLPANISLADELAEKLGISYDSVYRRIRGEKPLTISELQLLCKTYHISLDSVLALQSDAVVFFAPDINKDLYSFGEYIQSMLRQMKHFNTKPGVKMRYFCKDMTFFLFFMFPEIAAFKSFFYVKTLRNEAPYRHRKFSLKNDEFSSFYETGQQIIREYNNIPSIEIWNVESINSTLSQIAFYRDSGVFETREDLKSVIDSFEAIIDHLLTQLESGCKHMPGEGEVNQRAPIELYNNEILLGNNSILMESEKQRECWITYNALNYMVTRDERFCTKSFATFDNLLSRSTLISGTGEKERNKLFMQFKEKINGLREGSPF
jgi:transcriptional regulator with XRE-family HTH domain